MTDAAMQNLDEALFNPFAPGYTDNPYPQYARLREQAPVYQHPLGFWILTRYGDVAALLRSGNSVEVRNMGPSPMRDLQRSVYGDEPPGFRGQSMLDRDPPDHTRLRRLVAKAFTRKSIEALRPHIVDLVDGMLDELAEAGGGNLISALAFPLPFAVITEMLGMPPAADIDRLRELTGTVVQSLEPNYDPEVMAAIAAAGEELTEITAEAIAWKREHPGDDLLTALIAAEDCVIPTPLSEGPPPVGDKLSDEELVAQVGLLYVAGHETTVNLIGNGVLALLRNPDQLELLRSRPDMAGNAVEELLRYDGPVQQSRRITLQPYAVDGVEIPTGAFVLAGLGAANRDQAHWGPDADDLRLDRDGAHQHVAFGAGPHHCLGAALARLEGQVAIERLVQRFDGLELAGEVSWNGRINLRGLAELPVAV
ncbi:MAG: cytochrome P450 [Actinophytocola sp.]|nr:cytochrome P450 [Actinophytocola sp.]